MLNLKSLLLGAALAAASLGAFAAPRADTTPGIDERQARQAERIDEALRAGKLSPRETRLLEREQRQIRRYEAQAKADGVVTRSERRELQAMLDRASRHIREQVRDGDRR